MCRTMLLLPAFFAIGALAAYDQPAPKAAIKVADGAYEVIREGAGDKDVEPIKDGEATLVHRHRYLKKDAAQPPRVLVVRSSPDVELKLVGEPKAEKEGDDVVRILLQLQPSAAASLERLTTNRVGKQIAIVIGGEVVTTHKIREVIKGGQVQITNCAPGAANYLLDQLKAQQK